jgi:hypothetical protein
MRPSTRCASRSATSHPRGTPDLLAALDAFLQEHRRCGELDAGVEPVLVWMSCDCGAELVQPLDEPSKDK